MDKLSLCLIIAIIILTGYTFGEIYIEKYNSCTSSPCVYCAQQFEEDYGNPFSGSGSFKDVTNRSFIVEFNSSGIKEVDPSSTKGIPVRVPQYSAEEIEKIFERTANISK